MSVNRREFIRRVAVASALLVTGIVSVWELVQTSATSTSGKSVVPDVLPLPSGNSTSPSASTAEQTVTQTQTVTVTEYAKGSSQQSGAQTSQQTSQQSSKTSSQSSTSTSTTQAIPAGYILVTPLSALAGKSSAYFNHPTRGLSILVSSGGQWKAFSATCTHQPCTVQYSGGASITCPCHGGTFNPSTGAVTGGPPPSPLPEMTVLIQNNNLYVSS